MLKTNQLGQDTQRDELLTRRAALMAAAGKDSKEIARTLNVSPATLKVWQSSPLWQEMVATYSDEVESRGMQTIVDELISDGPKNLDFIKRVRDGHFYEKKDRMDARLRAAKMLLDKQAPNADARAQNEQAANIILDGRLLSQVLRAMKNSGAIDITPEEIETATGESLPKLMSKTPEQFAETYAPDEDPEDAL